MGYYSINAYVGKEILDPIALEEEEFKGIRLPPSRRYITPLDSRYKYRAGKPVTEYSFEPIDVVENLLLDNYYPEIEDDLGMGHLRRDPMRRTSKQVRAVIARLQDMIPTIPETARPDPIEVMDFPRQAVQDFVRFLEEAAAAAEEAAAAAEAAEEYLWFLAI